jgi:hypothetical protein
MNTTAVLRPQLARGDSLATNALLALLAGWWRSVIATRAALASRRRSLDCAAALIERAAGYEASQPGFAADLRAAAALMQQQAGLRR